MLEVHYTLGWSGNKILSVEADVLMGNLSLPEDLLATIPGNVYTKRREIVPSRQRFHTLTQHFTTTFKHISTENDVDSAKEEKMHSANGVNEPVLKSGNPGYNKGKPLLPALYKFQEIATEDKVTSLIYNDSTKKYHLYWTLDSACFCWNVLVLCISGIEPKYRWRNEN